MTLPRKANHDSHLSISPALGRVAAAHTRRLNGQDMTKVGREGNGISAWLCRQKDGVAGVVLFRNETAARRCANGLRVRSTVLLRGGVASWEPNQQRDGRRCLEERFEQLFEEISPENVFPNSGASAASFGPTKRPMSSSRSGRAAPSARRNSTSRGTASLPMKRSWSCSTSCVRASGLEIQMVSRHRFDGIASPVIRCRTVQVVVHRVCSPVSDLRRACGFPHAADLPAPSAHTSEHVEPSDSCHAFAWHHHLLSDRSGALSPPCTGARHAGGVRDRGFREGADGGSPAVSVESQAKATRGKTASPDQDPQVSAPTGLRVGSSVVGSRTATSERMDATAGETAPSFSSANSFSGIGSARGTSAMLHPGAEDGSTASLAGRDSGDRAERRSTISSSGDGLGILEPGSMTRGFASRHQPPSGRARERAMCPAVARSFSVRRAV